MGDPGAGNFPGRGPVRGLACAACFLSALSRTGVSRLLLLALVGVLLFALVRLFSDGDGGGGAVAFTDLEPDGLERRAFRLSQPVRLAIGAGGSFEADTTMAAYAWIVRRTGGVRGGEVVWRMRPRRPARGTFAAVADTVTLTAGVYDAYFASYGDPIVRRRPRGRGFRERLTAFFSRDGRVWHGDASRWYFRVDPADPADAEALEGADEEDGGGETDSLLWAGRPAHAGERHEHLFEVTAPVAVRLVALAGVERGAVRDTARLERMGTGVVWAMTARGTTWAGGALRNRRADTTLTLTPGLYRATFRAADDHAYDHWAANPPFIPTAWGLAVAVADPAQRDRIVAFDPWARLPRIASFTCVSDDRLEEASFTLPDTTAVLVYALGEVIGSSVYDYGWLTSEPAPGAPSTTVWEMTSENTRHAGGGDKNREAEALLTLAPGTYTLHYRTDGSHACHAFNDEEPAHPDRWGITLFALDPTFDLARIAYHDALAFNHRRHAGGGSGGAALADLTRLGNDTLATAAFQLDAPASVRIVAVGEIVPSQRLDYGWITNAAGQTVWQMTRENTQWAGGSKKNRTFDGAVALDAGTYTVHFQTDGAHAYNAFLQQPPSEPSAWGIRVERAEE